MATTTTAEMRPLPAPLSWLLAPLALLERTRGRWRLALLLAYLAIATTVGALTWWATSLWKLPDIGDPFDVAAFGTVEVPDDRNAYVLYRQAAGRLRTTVNYEDSVIARRRSEPGPDWWNATPSEEKDELARNADALELWRKGTERPDALDVQPKDYSFKTILTVPQRLLVFSRLALLEAARRMDAGDMAGAWRYYRADLRASRHLGMHAAIAGRFVGIEVARQAAGAAERWASDPRVAASLLRQALDDMKVIEAMTAKTSTMLHAEYFGMMSAVDEPGAYLDEPLGDGSTWYHHLPGFAKTVIAWRREGERARRVFRMAFANWLSRCDLPSAERGLRSRELELYPMPPDAPLTREELEAWAGTSALVIALRSAVCPSIRSAITGMDQDRLAVASLRVMLAQHLYFRERGKPITKLGDLIGPYLDKLPPDFAPQDAPLTLTTPAPVSPGPKP